MRRSRKLGAAALTLVLAAAGCGGTGNAKRQTPTQLYAKLSSLPYQKRMAQLRKCAKREGRVVMYSTADADLLKNMKTAFEKRYPQIKMSYVSSGGSELYQKFELEARAGKTQADVVRAGEEIKLAHNQHLLAEHIGAFAPQEYPKAQVGSWWLGLGSPLMGITINTDKVDADQAPKSYKDLLNSKWNGRIGLQDDPRSLVTTLVAAWGEKKTAGWLKTLIRQKLIIINGGTSQTQQFLAAGKFAVSPALYMHNVLPARAKGAPLKLIVPKDAIPAGTGSFAISSDAPHPCAAALLSNFIISPAGGRVRNSEGRITVNPHVKVTYPIIKKLQSDPRVLLGVPSKKSASDPIEVADRLIKEIIVPASRSGR